MKRFPSPFQSPVLARRLAAAFASAALLGWASPCLADVKMTVLPILGSQSPPGFGFSELSVRLESTDKGVVRGVLTAAAESPSYRTKEAGAITSADFVLSPGSSATLRIPVVAQASWQLEVVARSEGGLELAKESVRTFSRDQPVIVDVRSPSRLPAMLGDVQITPRRMPVGGRGSGMQIAASTVSTDPTTGDPVLPDRPTGYSQAAVVCFPSDVLTRLVGAELDALAGYVLGGGTLAVNIVRPEDLRHPTLVALVGGQIEDLGPAKHLARHLVTVVDTRSGSGGSGGSGGSSGSSGWSGSGGSGGSGRPHSVLPQMATREALHGYAGGNLVPSDFGATAAYGLGEVHLLAFDPASPTLAEDRWVAGTLAELTRHAWDRTTSVALPQGTGIARYALQDIRKQLDPNEGSRWAIFVSALLLLAYAAIAGPWSFLSASRAGNPLRALKLLPLFSAVTFSMVVGLGMISRGFSGQSRRLSLIELGGGMSRGSIHRFRGFFTPRATTIKVSSTTASAVMELPLDEGSPTRSVVHRDGLRLENLGTLPWETIVVREEDVANLGAGVTIGRRADGDLDVVNHTGRALRGLLVWVPKKGVYFHGALKDGAAVLGGAGTYLGKPSAVSSYASRNLFDGFAPDKELDGLSPGLADSWRAFEKASSRAGAPHYWPTEVPVVLAQVDGGEGERTDAGLPIDRDRLLVRVIGFGGSP